MAEESSTLRSSSEKPSPFPKRPRVSFTTVGVRTFSNGENDPIQALSSPKERALSPISDPAGGLAHVESDSGEVTANVESLSRLVLEDELDARSKHVDINESREQLERVLLKQASPMRTPTADQETSPLPENWDLYKQFKSSQAAQSKASPELASTSRRVSPRAPAPSRGPLRPRASKCSPRRSPDTVDMSGVVRSIQMGPNREDDGRADESLVPEGRKSFATFQSLEPGPEIYAVKQAGRRLQEPMLKTRAMQRHQHHRSDLMSSAERFREMQDQVMKETQEDQQLMEVKGQMAKKALQAEQQAVKDLEDQVSQARMSVEETKEELRQARKRLLRQKAQRVALQQAQSARSCFVTHAMPNFAELRLRGASGTVKVEGPMATLTLRTRNEEMGRAAWQEALEAHGNVEKAEDIGCYKEATVPVHQLPELLRRVDFAFLRYGGVEA